MTTARRPPFDQDEVLDTVFGKPCLYKFTLGDSEKPLVVLVPGGAHNARIFYGGHAGHDPEDFLCTWLHREGYGTLAISYPLQSEPELLPATAPGFRINEWGGQAAEVTRTVVDQNALCGDVVLVGWSMAGKILVPYSNAVRSIGLNLKLFVSLAATPGLSNTRTGHSGVTNTEAGYATFNGMLELFMTQIREQERLNHGKTIMSEDVYRKDYYGSTPVNLPAWGLKYSAQHGFIDDEGLSVADAAANDTGSMPWLATLVPTSQLDARHALLDKAIWALLLSQKLTGAFEKRLRDSPAAESRWAEIIKLVHTAPGALSRTITGNHFFFLGKEGAQATARGIIRHMHTAGDLEATLMQLMA